MIRNGDPRLQRTDSSNSNLSMDGPPRSSPIKNKPLKSFPPSNHLSPQLNEKIAPSIAKPLVPGSSSATSGGDPNSESTKKTKPEPPLPPLLVTSLGDADTVKRAETVLLHLHEVAPNVNAKIDSKELPSKTSILKAVEEIEKLVKTTKSQSDDAERETKKAKEEEEAKRAREATIKEEEDNKRQQEAEKKKEERKMEEEHSKVLAEQEAEDQSKIRFEEAIKTRKTSLLEQITKAKDEKKSSCEKALEAKLKESSAAMDKSVARSRREMEKAKTLAKDLTKKLAKADKAHKAITEIEKKKKQKKKKPMKEESIPLEDIINSITLENRRKTKEAHALSLSMTDAYFGLDRYKFKESNQYDTPYDIKDPKYQKTYEEWSIMANQVSGLSDCLFPEPSDTPYFEQNERNHAVVGPLVKEFVRDKQKRLNKHWLMLAEEYEVRKRLYEKQQRKRAKKPKRVSVTSRKSILGDKEKEKPDDQGGKNSEPGGRSSNNPYRRARRGNEVRSEYEQEQIIAEIAAKEAMEKRITHGGSKIPRQEHPLERVSNTICL